MGQHIHVLEFVASLGKFLRLFAYVVMLTWDKQWRGSWTTFMWCSPLPRGLSTLQTSLCQPRSHSWLECWSYPPLRVRIACYIISNLRFVNMQLSGKNIHVQHCARHLVFVRLTPLRNQSKLPSPEDMRHFSIPKWFSCAFYCGNVYWYNTSHFQYSQGQFLISRTSFRSHSDFGAIGSCEAPQMYQTHRGWCDTTSRCT